METHNVKNSSVRNIRISLGIIGVLTLIAVLLSSCSDSDSRGSMKGQANVKVTDAAVDTESITGVYLSVSEVQAISNEEIKTIATFSEPQVFNLMAYQNGETYTLGSGDIEVGTYSEIRFIMSGSDSYLMFDDGTTEPLNIPSGTSSGYKVKGTFEVVADGTTDIVADIDLRKALILTGEQTYKLRPTGRLLMEKDVATIYGTVSGNTTDRMVVYAYEKGTYSSSEESEPATGETRFQNSVNSAIVGDDGTYTLAFMNEGEYDIVVASYSNLDQDEDLEFEGVLTTSLLVDGFLQNFLDIDFSASADVEVNIVVE